MKNFLSSFAFALLFFSATIFSQITPILQDSSLPRMPEEFIVEDIKGKIANKPSFLPKPDYPTAAKQAGIEGTVRVRIKVGVEGSVTEAEAFQGPAELRVVCEEAALKTRFVIARDAENKPIVTEGHLTYTFEIKMANWIKIGYHLTFLQMFSVAMAPLSTIIKAIPDDWKDEQEQFKKLKEIQKKDFAKYPPQPTQPALITPTRTVGVIGQRRAVIVGQLPIPIQPRPTNEQVELVQKLIPVLHNRLKDDALNAWKFKVGLGLGKVMILFRNPVTQNDAVAILKELQTTAPPEANPKVVAELDYLSKALQKVSERGGINEALFYILSSK